MRKYMTHFSKVSLAKFLDESQEELTMETLQDLCVIQGKTSEEIFRRFFKRIHREVFDGIPEENIKNVSMEDFTKKKIIEYMSDGTH